MVVCEIYKEMFDSIQSGPLVLKTQQHQPKLGKMQFP